MKYLIFLTSLLIGIAVGIGGEFLIPKKYSIPLTYGCIRSKGGQKNVFMPSMSVYQLDGKPSTDNPKRNKLKNYPLSYYSSSDWSVPNYGVLYEFLMGRVEILSIEECNRLVGLKMEGEMDHYSQYFDCKSNVDWYNW